MLRFIVVINPSVAQEKPVSRTARRAQQFVIIPTLFAFALFMSGCMDITGRGPARLDRTVDATQRTQHTRVGTVYCMRGFLGIFSEGMDALADEINTQVGATAVSVANEERDRLRDWIVANHQRMNNEPLVLLGHSYGADDMIRIAEALQKENITVDLVCLIDPVTPPKVPTNVKRVYCVYKSHPLTDWYPAWRGVPADVVDPTRTPIVNIDLRTTEVGFDTTQLVHPTIDKSEGVHKLCIEQIKQICITRTAWAEAHPAAGAAKPVSDSSSPPAPSKPMGAVSPVPSAPPTPSKNTVSFH
jgi:hypothetical protein